MKSYISVIFKTFLQFSKGLVCNYIPTFLKIIGVTFFFVIFGGDLLALILWLLSLRVGGKSIRFHFQLSLKSSSLFLESLSIWLTSTPPFVGPLLNLICLVYFSRTWCWYIPYAVYVLCDTRPFRGGGKSPFFRRLIFWKFSQHYFPLTMLKHDESVLYPPDRPYLFGYHPHGILGGGVVLSFACESSDFLRLFPGIDVYVGTLNSLFRVPFLHDWILAQGFISVNRESLSAILSQGAGKAVAIVVGGAKEALLTSPDVCQLILRPRKGFFREGIRHGCRLVPVFCFGENMLYNVLAQDTSSIWIHLSILAKKHFGFTVPAFTGRGIWQSRLGLLPARVPLTAVFGIPVDCPKILDPTDEDIREVQNKYCQHLVRLYEDMKKRGIPGSECADLRIT